MTKKISMILFFIILVLSYSVYAIEYPMALNEWGNPHFVDEQDSTQQFTQQYIVCYPFVALHSGYIHSVYSYITDVGVGERLMISISDNIPYTLPSRSGALSYFITSSGSPYIFNDELSITEQYDNDYHKNFFFPQGEELFICFSMEDVGDDARINFHYLNNYPMDISQVSSIIPNWDTTSRMTYNTLWGIPVNSTVKMVWDIPTEKWILENQDRIATHIKICQRETLITDDSEIKCYYPYSYVGSQSYINAGRLDATDYSRGEWFKWDFNDNSVENVDVWLYGSTSYVNSSTMKFTFVETDQYGNITSVLYHATDILHTAEDSSYEGKWCNFSFPSINLIENHYYAWLIGCQIGCGGATTLNMGLTSTTDSGFFGDDARIITNASTGITSFASQNDLTFKLTLSNLVNYISESSIDTDFCINSPFSNCLFYDDFLYSDSYDLSLREYTGNHNTFFIEDTKLYAFANQSIFNNIEHELEVTDYIFNNIESIYTFNINEQITPLEMDWDNESTQYIIYKIRNMCDNVLSNQIQLQFFRYQNYTISDRETLVNVYVFELGKSRLIGTFPFNNGDNFDVIQKFDFQNKKGFIQIYKKSVIDDFTINYDYNLDSICKINKFSIIRDGEFITDDDFISIDSIAYNGIKDSYTEEEYEFLYGNQTGQDDAIVEGEIGELINNMAFTLGFKTVASKFFFWLIMIIILSLLISQANVSSSIKGFAVGTVIITGLIIGWYFKLVPTVIFALLIFIVSIIGAFLYHKSFMGNTAT